MVRVYRRPEELVQLYNYSQEGLTTKEIAEKTGISYVTVTTALSVLDRYLKGKTRNQRKFSSSYKSAVKLIRKQVSPKPKQPQEETPGDNFSYLKNSFDAFQHAVSTFIEVETNSRYQFLKEENATLKEENRQLREELERKKLEEPKNLNWIDALVENLPKEESE